MRKQLILAALLVIPALGFAAYRDARPQSVAANPDVLCGPSFCAQLVPYRVRMGSEAPPVGGS